MLRQRTLTSATGMTRSFATSAGASAKRLHPNVLGLVIGAGAVGAAAGTLISRARCSDDVLVAPAYPWSHKSEWKSYDVASLRRGHQVYKEVCAACHSLNYIAWRNLIETLYTEEEVIAMAAETEVEDGPNDDGEMFTRPGKPTDYLPRPYPNEEAARCRLHLRSAHRLHARPRWPEREGGPLLQPLLPRWRHRHASPPQRWDARVRGWHRGERVADGQGRVGLPVLDRPSRARRAEGHGHQGPHLPRRPLRLQLVHQEVQVVRPEEPEGPIPR
ncbi:cytochrome c1, putative [Acanthamoeba castellanii str. Neff]|uniref:Cytochrome c1, putative n=1 Tax=Acanthamoeba castellanii (strain ATCC 30010 / Neff) TaxID=1257118 RepID=L8GSQ3_ACACF|nr:cytochrome c1, putative [Acanthamoeba castellanii str. Neff]ELR16030.1 cytochrome c1, putative [Acanthamoeba castellanii str. Neff]